MTWFKVDDKFHDHRKVRRASLEAIGLWTLAGSWSSDNLTDGFIPDQIVRRWSRKWSKLASELITAELWIETEVDGEHGFLFYNWHERNPLRARVEEEREAARKRMSQVRSSRSANVRPNNERTEPEPSGEPEPNAADAFGKRSATPTRPDRSSKRTTGGASRATQMPADWKPKDDHLALAIEYGLDPAYELRAFKDRNEAKGGTYKNWDAAFRTWLNQAKTFRGGQHAPAPSPAARKHLPTEVPSHIDPDDVEAYAKWARESMQ